jgi:NTP pyrophosphatase (non-canonical NTP hydrolase)
VSTHPAEGGDGLTFDAFRAANVARCVKWHPAGIASWSPSDWLTAVTGELGELASLLKMRNRERDGLPGNKFSPTDKHVADELADVLTYLDLLAAVLGVDLGRAAVAKFNEVSERVGFPDRIPAPPPQPVAPDTVTIERSEYERMRAAENAMRFSKDERWYWQGDGTDDPESLTCPVVMTADTLRELLSKTAPSALRYRDPTIEDAGNCYGAFLNHNSANSVHNMLAALNAIGAKVGEK